MESYANILDLMLEQVKVFDDAHISIGNTKQKLHKHGLIVTSALNVILVLNEARLAYRIDIPNISFNTYLIEYIKNICPNIIDIPIPIEEPLLLLEKNKQTIETILNEGKSFDMCMAKILGYPYCGPNWYKDIKKYMFHYYVVDNNNVDYNLYSFMCPILEYTNEIREKILNDKVIYELILEE